MKMTQSFNLESVMNISDKISLYLDSAESGVKNVIALTRKVINESLNTKG